MAGRNSGTCLNIKRKIIDELQNKSLQLNLLNAATEQLPAEAKAPASGID
jgi:hypothetical protein